MGIDVLNHMWVCVFSASFSRQFGDGWKARTAPPIDDADTDRIVGEAMTEADLALAAYRRTCHAYSSGGADRG